jgi:hypothetical protein
MESGEVFCRCGKLRFLLEPDEYLGFDDLGEQYMVARPVAGVVSFEYRCRACGFHVEVQRSPEGGYAVREVSLFDAAARPFEFAREMGE